MTGPLPSEYKWTAWVSIEKAEMAASNIDLACCSVQFAFSDSQSS